LRKPGAERGYLRGKTWWDCGESAVEKGRKRLAKNTPAFLHFSYFFYRNF
jgi:hypothetical protein